MSPEKISATWMATASGMRASSVAANSEDADGAAGQAGRGDAAGRSRGARRSRSACVSITRRLKWPSSSVAPACVELEQCVAVAGFDGDVAAGAAQQRLAGRWRRLRKKAAAAGSFDAQALQQGLGGVGGAGESRCGTGVKRWSVQRLGLGLQRQRLHGLEHLRAPADLAGVGRQRRHGEGGRQPPPSSRAATAASHPFGVVLNQWPARATGPVEMQAVVSRQVFPTMDGEACRRERAGSHWMYHCWQQLP